MERGAPQGPGETDSLRPDAAPPRALACRDAGEGLLSGPGTGGFPLIVKPSAGSGSRGVRLIRDAAEWAGLLAEGFDPQGWIVESWCPGPSYSLEICGTPGHYRVFQVTGLLMDEVFDCRGVLAPSDAPPAAIREMEAELLKLAEALRLRGLMDLEVILAPDGLRVLEIDARFPSQTPTAVWLSTGWNLAEYLVSCFIPYEPAPGWESPRCVRYEHVCRTEDGEIVCRGEHVMAGAGPLEGSTGFLRRGRGAPRRRFPLRRVGLRRSCFTARRPKRWRPGATPASPASEPRAGATAIIRRRDQERRWPCAEGAYAL